MRKFRTQRLTNPREQHEEENKTQAHWRCHTTIQSLADRAISSRSNSHLSFDIWLRVRIRVFSCTTSKTASRKRSKVKAVYNKRLHSVFLAVLVGGTYSFASAQSIDPEVQIKKSGAQTTRLGDDGKTRFFNYTERGNSERISSLEKGIAALPKRAEVFQVCDQMRGSVKATLIRQSGESIDVAAVNWGYSGATIACALKYMRKNRVGTQLIYIKQGTDGVYMYFVAD